MGAKLHVDPRRALARVVPEMLFSSDGTLKGIRLQDDAILESKGCICTIHPQNLLKIVPNSLFRPTYVKRLKNLEETASAYMLYGRCHSHLDILSS